MKRKSQAKGIAGLEYGEWPFFGGQPSADAADAARYRYLVRPNRPRDHVIHANEPKSSYDAALDAVIANLCQPTS